MDIATLFFTYIVYIEVFVTVSAIIITQCVIIMQQEKTIDSLRKQNLEMSKNLMDNEKEQEDNLREITNLRLTQQSLEFNLDSANKYNIENERKNLEIFFSKAKKGKNACNDFVLL